MQLLGFVRVILYTYSMNSQQAGDQLSQLVDIFNSVVSVNDWQWQAFE